MSERRMIEAVIFDCDGVLVDSEPATLDVVVANLARHGLALSHTEANQMFVGGTLRGVGERARAMGAPLPDSWVDDTYAEIYARLRAGIPAMEGVHGLLDALEARGMPYAVASNGSIEKMSITLGQTGLWERFEGRMISAHVAGVAKPDPRLFLIAAEVLGRPPGTCAVVEDSPSGCTAARDAGMRCFGLVPEGDGARLAALGAQVVRSLAEVRRELGLEGGDGGAV